MFYPNPLSVYTRLPGVQQAKRARSPDLLKLCQTRLQKLRIYNFTYFEVWTIQKKKHVDPNFLDPHSEGLGRANPPPLTMGGSKKTSDNKRANPELTPLIINDGMVKGNKGYGDIETPQSPQSHKGGGFGHNGGNLSRDRDRDRSMMVDRGYVMYLSYIWKASENRR